MNKTVVIEALEAQLQTKKTEVEQYESTVSGPALKTKHEEILNWLRENVSNLIPNIEVDTHRMRVFKTGSPNDSWGGLTISLESNYWKSEEREVFAKMNWYGSSASTKDENTLADVQIFGAVASKLGVIEYEFKNNWRPTIESITTPVDNLYSEISKLEYSVRDIKNSLAQEEKDTYKKAGFACKIKPSMQIVTNWDKEGNPRELKEVEKEIKLSTGRSNYDYAYVNSFKVVKTNKYKTTLEIVYKDRKVEYEVTANKFNAFIDDVYEWQNVQCDRESARNKERYENFYKKENA